MAKNPYTLVFGKEPKQRIGRTGETATIIENLEDDDPATPVYMVSGVRGSGKTVFLTDISEYFKKEDDWIVVDLSSESDMLDGLASYLASNDILARLFKSAKINLSFWGIGLEVSGTVPITNIQLALTKMLESIKNNGKRVLVTIDEAVNNKYMKEFASVYQIFLRQKLPICLVMTGLFENIDALQNEKNLTFLYRAPKVVLRPLNAKEIALNYQKNLKVSHDDAQMMAELTAGYSFAFQVLGHFSWDVDGRYKEIINDYKNYISEYSYDKIWSELSDGDKKILYGIARVSSDSVADVKKYLNISTNEFNPYRKRLIKKGLIDGEQYGHVKFVLPFFKEYVIGNYE